MDIDKACGRMVTLKELRSLAPGTLLIYNEDTPQEEADYLVFDYLLFFKFKESMSEILYYSCLEGKMYRIYFPSKWAPVSDLCLYHPR